MIESDNIERRRKIIVIPVRWIVTLLAGGFLESDHVKIPKIVGLPESAINVGWYHDFALDAFVLVMQDASFDEVESGCLLPTIIVEWNTVCILRAE